MGGMPSGIKAKAVGQKPNPRPTLNAIGKAKAVIASDGRARPTLATLSARKPPRPMWPSATPRGSASSAATISENADTSRCSPNRVGTPLEPCQCAGSANHVATCQKKLIDFSPRPRREPALDEEERSVGGHRKTN